MTHGDEAHDHVTDAESDAGGESACFAQLVCTVCGAVIESEPHKHRPGFDVDQ
jgi:transcription initiation factor TFIIIB Brf1 subunit/transcription initiation factor TFIIB